MISSPKMEWYQFSMEDPSGEKNPKPLSLEDHFRDMVLKEYLEVVEEKKTHSKGDMTREDLNHFLSTHTCDNNGISHDYGTPFEDEKREDDRRGVQFHQQKKEETREQRIKELQDYGKKHGILERYEVVDWNEPVSIQVRLQELDESQERDAQRERENERLYEGLYEDLDVYENHEQ